MTVAVVGAGIAGAACARALVRGGHEVQVLDRGRAVGGRMASRTVDDRRVDTGASYFTARDPRFTAQVDDWLERGLARPWTDVFSVAGPDGLRSRKPGPLRYGSPTGLRTLVADLLTGLPVQSEVDVAGVGPGARVDGAPYDAVVLAMPDPQAERLLDPSLTAARAAVAGRAWEPVLALSAGFAERSWDDDFDGCFVEDSDRLGWIADDGRRRGDGAPVLVAHSTAPFATAHLRRPDGATDDLVRAVQGVLDLTAAPRWTHVQRWSLARPAEPRDEPFHLDDEGIGLCGDGWGSPKVETAWLSGHLLGERLAAAL